MDYKGIKYQLVRTTHPTGLKWTVEIEGSGQIGSCHTRAAATTLAHWTIDKLVKPNRSDEL